MSPRAQSPSPPARPQDLAPPLPAPQPFSLSHMLPSPSLTRPAYHRAGFLVGDEKGRIGSGPEGFLRSAAPDPPPE